ncbi:MAG: alanine--tRNA ligase [Burkholderiaceae bacterium]|nr:alanine--tRNA ligase [Burkholderiaceae bacterium]
MKSAEIREKFLRFFESKGHTIVSSSPVVPGDDPTLLFTNAGMNQFKDVFLGFDKRAYSRAVTSQKCIRAGGKHNDLENVGYTARHHTFFEMLGNFSFGDYFKRDAIAYAWELLTRVFGLPAERLWVTVYDEDDEAYQIWARDIGVPAERIVRIGDNKGARYASDNFWMMGDTGPCGPCSEIFYDHGEGIEGGPPGSPDEDGDRYIEIWNNVFMQFNRDEHGVMHPLPKPSVDTGMGLERIAAVLQGVHSNYEIDLFVNLLRAAAEAVRDAGGDPPADSPSLKVLADHIRACAFTVCDGVIPGNEGRGYVLRRIARRAIRHGYKLGARRPFFHRLVGPLVAEMGDAFPELRSAGERVTEVLRLEEERFFETIAHGMEILEQALAPLRAAGGGTLDGETAFKLHDTYGFPLDLTADVCREIGVTVDDAGFERAMDRQREQARAAGKFRAAAGVEYSGQATDFRGYDTLEVGATVLALYRDGTPVGRLAAGDAGIVVLDRTPFYAESGGQVGDRGVLVGTSGTNFRVDDTQKIQADVFGHHGELTAGGLGVGDTLEARVDVTSRRRTMRHHSVTHLMHKALREVLGVHVQQKGSLVDDQKTRFDFSHNAPMTATEIARVETIVNLEILENAETRARVMAFDDAVRGGAMALFGEKYGDDVRVLDIGSSRELCGGTHVGRTGDIGLFKIIAEGGVAAGIRRIEAVAGDVALVRVQQDERILGEAAAALKVGASEVAGKLAQILEGSRGLEKELARLKSKLAASQGDDLADGVAEVEGVRYLGARLEGVDVKALRDTMDKLKDRLKSAVIVLGADRDGKVSLIAGVTPDLTDRFKAGELVNHVARQVGGKGGGRADMAQAGGTDVAALPAALASVRAWIVAKTTA